MHKNPGQRTWLQTWGVIPHCQNEWITGNCIVVFCLSTDTHPPMNPRVHWLKRMPKITLSGFKEAAPSISPDEMRIIHSIHIC